MPLLDHVARDVGEEQGPGACVPQRTFGPEQVVGDLLDLGAGSYQRIEARIPRFERGEFVADLGGLRGVGCQDEDSSEQASRDTHEPAF
jgi:hypothetical protein